MKEHQRFENPIITPTTKAEHGLHDEDISRSEIISSGLITEEDYSLIEKYTLAVFMRGSEIAAEHGLILVDTKYEFGKKDGKIYFIDEINTPTPHDIFMPMNTRNDSEKVCTKAVVKGVCRRMAYG